MELRYSAIVLKKREVGETDRLYTFFTREAGKVTALAKGVRKPTAKLAASLENLTLVDLTIVAGRGSGKIAGALAEESFSALRKNFPFLELALSSAARLDRLTGEGERDAQIFDLTLEYFTLLSQAAEANDYEHGQVLAAGYFFKLARHLGYGSELWRCVTCGEPVREGERLVLSLEAGGVVHGEHGGANAIPVSPAVVKLLRLFADVPFVKLKKIVAGERPAREVERLSARMFVWIAP